MTLSITILGSGGSSGVPEIGCTCSVCNSSNPRNKRLRSSIIVHYNASNILIDTTPDFRQQMLSNNIQDISAILYTHAHADHVMGLADIRPLNFKKGIPIDSYCSDETATHIKDIFSYVFNAPASLKEYFPQVQLHTLNGSVEICKLSITPFTVLHHKMPVTAFRFDNSAYITDVSFIPEEHFSLLDGLDLLILDAFRYEKHISHFSLDEAIETAQQINARKTVFTHLSHAFDYEKVNNELPETMSLAYDGMKITPNDL